MCILFHDIETKSRLQLKAVGAWQYATDPSTDVWCCAYAVDDGPIQLWIPSDPIPPEFAEAARNPDWEVAAFNDNFERQIGRHIMAPRYGWPEIPIERRRCLQAAALALALPAGLADLVEALQLETRKDPVGQRIMLQMARPRKARVGEDPTRIYWCDDSERRAKLHAYCIQDVATERALYHRIGFLPAEEQLHWILDARINDRGIYIDRQLLDAAIQIAKDVQCELDAELHYITDGTVFTINQTKKMEAWLAANDCVVANLQKPMLQEALTRRELSPAVRRVIELRLDGAHAAAKKLQSMRNWIAQDGRIHGCFRYHGASPGRFTSLGVQVQNLKKPTVKDLGAAIEAVATGDLNHLRSLYPQPMSVIGDISRALVCAPPGRRLISADLSGIESRLTAWVSGQQSKIDQWAAFDRSGNPEDEPYFITGHRIFGLPKEVAREPGKTGDLAFGYMGGPGAWQKLAPAGDTSTEIQIKQRQQAWRHAHPQTTQFWHAIDRAARMAMRHPGKIVDYRGLAFRNCPDGFLRMRLSNGRKLAYPFPKLKTNSRGNVAVVFMDNQKGKWVECRHGQGAYGGTWTENAVQGIGRDLFVEAMQRLEAAGYGIVLHAHDEAVAEVPADFGSVEEFLQIFTTLPEWAKGLPVAAKARISERFCKISPPDAMMASESGDEDEATPEGLTDEDAEPDNDLPEAAGSNGSKAAVVEPTVVSHSRRRDASHWSS